MFSRLSIRRSSLIGPGTTGRCKLIPIATWLHRLFWEKDLVWTGFWKSLESSKTIQNSLCERTRLLKIQVMLRMKIDSCHQLLCLASVQMHCVKLIKDLEGSPSSKGWNWDSCEAHCINNCVIAPFFSPRTQSADFSWTILWTRNPVFLSFLKTGALFVILFCCYRSPKELFPVHRWENPPVRATHGWGARGYPICYYTLECLHGYSLVSWPLKAEWLS